MDDAGQTAVASSTFASYRGHRASTTFLLPAAAKAKKPIDIFFTFYFKKCEEFLLLNKNFHNKFIFEEDLILNYIVIKTQIDANLKGGITIG